MIPEEWEVLAELPALMGLTLNPLVNAIIAIGDVPNCPAVTFVAFVALLGLKAIDRTVNATGIVIVYLRLPAAPCCHERSLAPIPYAKLTTYRSVGSFGVWRSVGWWVAATVTVRASLDGGNGGISLSNRFWKLEYK